MKNFFQGLIEKCEKVLEGFVNFSFSIRFCFLSVIENILRVNINILLHFSLFNSKTLKVKIIF